MSNPTPGYIHALFHTASDDGISVLLARRHLARTWSGGRPVRGEVPNWAGQWGLISARPMVTQPAEQSVQAAVLSQTGIDLSAPQSAERYRIVRTETRTFADRAGTLTTALLLTCLPEGLAAFAADAQANLNSRKVEDGVLALVEVHPLSSGLNQVAPLPEPAQGWLQLVLEHGLASGQRAGAMAKALAERSAMTPSGALAALGLLADLPVSFPGAPGRLTGLRVYGARPSGDDWYQTWSPWESVLVQALTEPAGAEVAWEGGDPDPLGRADWHCLPRNRLSEPGAPFRIGASLGADRFEVSVAIVPELVGVELESGGEGVRVRARLAPDEAAAYRHLRWNGGSSPAGESPGLRLLTVAELGSGEGRLSLDAPS